MILRAHNPYRRATEALQRELRCQNYDVGLIDGFYGLRTYAAVRSLQKNRNITLDGIAGPQTYQALGRQGRPFNPWEYLYFLEPIQIRPLFPDVGYGTLRYHLPHVLRGLEHFSLMYQPLVLVALATIRAETAGFEPISEGPSKWNTPPDGSRFGLYDTRKELGNRGSPDGERYKGRGFIQLTGRTNYRVYGERIGVNLERNPERANDPKIAGLILGAFLADRKRRIVQAFENRDFIELRRLVNGGSHGLERFEKAMEAGQQRFCKALEDGCGCLF